MPGALSSRLLVSLDRCQALIIRSNSRNLRLQHPQLNAESRHTRTGNLGQPLVICVRDDAEQLLDTIASNRCDDAKLRKMSPDGIDHRRLLPDEQMACAVECQAALLLGVLVATNRMFALVTASQMASASVASFLCRLT